MVYHRNDLLCTQPFWHLWIEVFFRHATPKNFERNFLLGGKFRLFISPFSSDFTFLIYIFRVDKKDTKIGYEKIIAIYFGDKSSISIVFNTLRVLSVFITSYENQWASRKFHVSFAAEILNIEELYGEQIMKNSESTECNDFTAMLCQYYLTLHSIFHL